MTMHICPSKFPTQSVTENFKIQDGGWLTSWKSKIAISSKPFCQFWWNFAWWCVFVLQTLMVLEEFKFLKIQDGGWLPFWKLLKVICLQSFNRFWPLLVWQCIISPLNPIGFQKFENPKWRTAGIYKIEKSYLQNRLADFCKILHGDILAIRTLADV